MSKYARKTDSNQRDIVAALLKSGCSVLDLSRVGQGCPDLLVGRAGKCYLLEVKSLKGKLNPLQGEFHRAWNGNIAIVRTPEEAVKAITNG